MVWKLHFDLVSELVAGSITERSGLTETTHSAANTGYKATPQLCAGLSAKRVVLKIWFTVKTKTTTTKNNYTKLASPSNLFSISWLHVSPFLIVALFQVSKSSFKLCVSSQKYNSHKITTTRRACISRQGQNHWWLEMHANLIAGVGDFTFSEFNETLMT